jgi:hypothetical protein
MIKFITKIIKKMAKQVVKATSEDKLNLSSEDQKKLIDALVTSTSQLRKIKLQMILNEDHAVSKQLKDNETLLNSIK